MKYEVFKEGGKLSKTYYVFDIKGTKAVVDAVNEITKMRKCKAGDLEPLTMWVKGNDLYDSKVPGSKKVIAITGRRK